MDGLIIKYKFASRNAMRSEIETIKSYSSIKGFISLLHIICTVPTLSTKHEYDDVFNNNYFL